jgi:hypothetical protein
VKIIVGGPKREPACYPYAGWKNFHGTKTNLELESRFAKTEEGFYFRELEKTFHRFFRL